MKIWLGVLRPLEAGRFLIIFLIGAAGTMAGAVLGA